LPLIDVKGGCCAFTGGEPAAFELLITIVFLLYLLI
jgi:hypothetical protein